jgi:hypothetical protein
MAVAFSGLSAWSDETKLNFYLDSIASNDVLPYLRKYGNVFTNVKADTLKLPKMTTSITIADGDACFTDIDGNNDTTISQTSITLKKGLVRDQICVHGFEDYFTAQGLTAGQHYKGIGAFEAGILADVSARTAKAIGSEMWNGGSNWITAGFVDQLLTAVFNADNVGTTTPTSGGSAGTDSEGVYNICVSLLNKAMTNVDFASAIMAGKCHIVMSPKEYAFLDQNYVKLRGTGLITPGLQTLQAGTFAEFMFPGFPVPVVVQNFLTGTGIIMLSRNGNLTAAMDLESDFTNLKTGMDQYEEFLWWKFRFKGGVGYRDLTGSSIKYWGPAS